jgi:hypothetical protein
VLPESCNCIRTATAKPAGRKQIGADSQSSANKCDRHVDCSGYDNMSGFNVNFTQQQSRLHASVNGGDRGKGVVENSSGQEVAGV